MEYRTYTLQEYAEQIAHCHVNTLKKRIKLNHLPSNHKIKRGKQFMITVVPISDKCLACEKYFNASVEFNERKKNENPYELAAEMSIKYDLGITKFFKMHGL